jgi:hypothetical protein
MSGNLEEPGLELRPIVEPSLTSENPQEGILGEIPSFIGRNSPCLEEALNAALVLAEDEAVAILAGFAELQQNRIELWHSCRARPFFLYEHWWASLQDTAGLLTMND